MAEAIFEMVGKFQSGFPNISLSPEIVAQLTDGDSDPMFVTIPIMQVDATSRNGRTYNRAAVEAVVAAVNEKRVVGEAGHLRDEDRPYNWGASPVRWLKATIDENGTAWGKFYVLPSFPQIRDHIRVAKAAFAEIGTSIYGTAAVDEDGNVDPTTLEIESIDLAHPNRLGLPQLAKVPTVTAETVTEPVDPVRASDSTPKNKDADGDIDNPSSAMQEADMPDKPDESQVLSELRSDNDRLTARVRELEALEETNRRLNRDLSAVRTQLNIAETADPIREIHRLQNTVADQQTRLTDLTDIAISEAVNAQVEVETAREYVAEQLELHLRAERHELPSKDTIRQVLETVLQRDSVKAHIEAQAKAALGPNVTKTNRKPTETADDKEAVDELFPVKEGSDS